MGDRAEVTLVTFHYGDRTFERVFQEESLDALKGIVRNKLRLAPDADVRLSRLHGSDRQRIDLEDESDFVAFRIRTRQTRNVDVEVVLPDGEHPDAPPRKKQRTNATTDSADPKPAALLLPAAEIEPVEPVAVPVSKPKKRKQVVASADAPEESSVKKRKATTDNKHTNERVGPKPPQHESTEAALPEKAQIPNAPDTAPSKPKGRKKKVEQTASSAVAAVAPVTTDALKPAPDKQSLEPPVTDAPDPKPKGRKRKAAAAGSALTDTVSDAPTTTANNSSLPKSDEIAAFMQSRTVTVESLLANMAVRAPASLREKKKAPIKRKGSISTSADASGTTDSEYGGDETNDHWNATSKLKRAPSKNQNDQAQSREKDALQVKSTVLPLSGPDLDSAANKASDVPLDAQEPAHEQPEADPASVIDLTRVTPPRIASLPQAPNLQANGNPPPQTGSNAAVLSHQTCPICKSKPFHLRYQCSVIRGGAESIERRLAELRGSNVPLHVLRELEMWLEKYRRREANLDGRLHDDAGLLPLDATDNANGGDVTANELSPKTGEESATTTVGNTTGDSAQESVSSGLGLQEDTSSTSSSSSSSPASTPVAVEKAPVPLFDIGFSDLDLASQDLTALVRNPHLYIPDESVQDETSPPMELAESETEREQRPRRSLAKVRDSDSEDALSDDDQGLAKPPSFEDIEGKREDTIQDMRGDRAFSQALRAEARLSPSIIIRTGPDVLATQPSEAEEDAQGIMHSEPDLDEEASTTLTPKPGRASPLEPESPIETFTQTPRKVSTSPSTRLQVFVELPTRPQTPRKPITYAKKNRTPGRNDALADNTEDHEPEVNGKDDAKPVVEDSASEIDGDDETGDQSKPETPKPAPRTRRKAAAARATSTFSETPNIQSTGDESGPPTVQRGRRKAVLKPEVDPGTEVTQPSASKRPAASRRRTQLPPEVDDKEADPQEARGRSLTRATSVPPATKRDALRKRLADPSLPVTEEQPDDVPETVTKKKRSSSAGRPRLSEDVKALRQQEKEAKAAVRAAAREAEMARKRQAKAAEKEEKNRLAQEKKDKAATAKAEKATKASAAKKAKARVQDSPESEDDAPETLKESQTSQAAGSSQKPRMSLPGWTAVPQPATSSPTTQHGSMVDQLESEDVPRSALLPAFTQTKTQVSPQMSSMDEAVEVEASLGSAADEEVTPRPVLSRSSPSRHVDPSSVIRTPVFATQPERPKRRDTRGLQALSTFTLSPHQPVKPKPKPAAATRHTVSEVDRLAAIGVEEDSSDDGNDDGDTKSKPNGLHAKMPLKTRRAGVGVAGLGRSRMSSPRKL